MHILQWCNNICEYLMFSCQDFTDYFYIWKCDDKTTGDACLWQHNMADHASFWHYNGFISLNLATNIFFISAKFY